MYCLRQPEVRLHSHPIRRQSVQLPLQLRSQITAHAPHSWRQPEASCTSDFVMESIALAIICLAVSPMPIGRTLGFLSSAIRRQARRGETHLGSTRDVQSLFATRASELHRSVRCTLESGAQSLHPCASTPEGPADPVVRIGQQIGWHWQQWNRR